MVFYVKSVGTNVTLVDINSNIKFNVPPAALEKLFGIEMKEGEVWELNLRRRDDIEDNFARWRAISQLS